MKKAVKIICIFICVIMCLGLVLSPVAVMGGHNHDCAGEDCHICQSIITLKQLIGGGIIAFCLAAVFSFIYNKNVMTAFKGIAFCNMTPIGRKVKLTI